MKIIVYAKIASKEIMKSILDYCQKWDCYPAIEHFKDKESFLEGMEKKDTEIIVLARDERHNTEIMKEIHRKKWDIKSIQILENELLKKEFILAEKMAKELSVCGIPSSNTSLCRVHLKPKDRTENIRRRLL